MYIQLLEEEQNALNLLKNLLIFNAYLENKRN